MGAKLNLVGQRFGKLIVIQETTLRKNNSVIWDCRCDCGNHLQLSTKELRSDGVIQCHNCGNSRKPQTGLTEDIIGKKFNHLTVLSKSDKRIGGKIGYKCQCDCEKQTITYVSRTDLESNHIISCGCAKRKYQIGDKINNREIIGITGTKNNQFYYKVKCLFCNREYEITGYGLKKTFSCGCQKSLGEFNIIQVLNQNNIKYKKEYCFPGSQFRFDFAILNENNEIIRLIEFDGEQHYKQNIKNSGWNTYEKYQYTLENDLKKNQIAKDNNIPLARIPYWKRDEITMEILFGPKYEI